MHEIHEAGGGESQHDLTIKAFVAGKHARKPNHLSLNYFSADYILLLVDLLQDNSYFLKVDIMCLFSV